MQATQQARVAWYRRFGGLFWRRDFGLLWIGETVSETGNAMATVGVPLVAVTVLHASTFAVAALTAAVYLPWLAIGLPAGAWVDRLPCRSLMIICDFGSMLLYASVPLAAWLKILTIAQLLTVVLLAGAFNVVFTIAYQVYLPTLVTTAELLEGNAKLQGSLSVATVSGQGATGLAAQAFGAVTTLLFNAASFLVSASCLLLISRAKARPESVMRTTSVRREVVDGIRFVWRDDYLRPLTLYGAVVNLALTGSGALLVPFLIRAVGLNSAITGLLIATGSAGGVAGALAARYLARKLGTARALLISSTGAGLIGLLIPLTGPGLRLAYFVIGESVGALGIVVVNIIIGSFRQAYCPLPILGRVTATVRVLTWGAIPLGALLAGAIGTAFGVRNALWAGLGIGALSTALLFTRSIRQRKDMPTAADLVEADFTSQPPQLVAEQASASLGTPQAG